MYLCYDEGAILLNENPDLVVCRCEEVTLSQLEAAYSSGGSTSRQIKMHTRATMGACQGRVCRQLVDHFIHAKDPSIPRDATQLSYRQPIRPVTFGQLAEDEQ